MITMGSPYFVWINNNDIISSWYLLDAVCVTPPLQGVRIARRGLEPIRLGDRVGKRPEVVPRFRPHERPRVDLSPPRRWRHSYVPLYIYSRGSLLRE